MESSSSANTGNSVVTNETVSNKASTRASTAKQISFMEHLEFRGITDEPSEDRLFQHFNSDIIRSSTSRIVVFQKLDNLLRMLEESTKVLRRAIRDRAEEDGFPFYDALRQDIMEWKPQAEHYRRFPPMPPNHFDWDRSDCTNSSEATFHRTIMMTIIDRYDCRSLFAFCCEEQWKMTPNLLIRPTRRSSHITQPKPDLSISFRRSALAEGDFLDFPTELGKCLPPGNKGRERWFPFFFMEAKRNDDSLREAFEKNLHSASQALYNIYQWMRVTPELETQFFEDVRVFTVDLNNEVMILRMHRAELASTGRLRYRFAEVARARDYDRFDACHMIKSVLVDYARPHLLPILSKAFRTATLLDLSAQGKTKRKHESMQLGSTAESSRSVSEIPNQVSMPSMSTTVSAGLEALLAEVSTSPAKRNRPTTRSRRDARKEDM